MVEHNTTSQDNVTIIALKGELDLSCVEEVKPVFLGLLDEDHPNIVIDMKELEFMDSSGLSLIVEVFKRVRVGKGDMKLARLNDSVTKLFEMTRLNQVFEIYDSVPESVESFAA